MTESLIWWSIAIYFCRANARRKAVQKACPATFWVTAK